MLFLFFYERYVNSLIKFKILKKIKKKFFFLQLIRLKRLVFTGIIN